MSQSLVQNFMHIIFSTKHRQPLIDSEIEVRLHEYLGGICNKFNSPPIKIGGYHDHVHILCLLSKTIALTTLLQGLKNSSSKWIKYEGNSYKNFYWQNGYGAFSVSPKDKEKVIYYIANQHEHHKKITFQAEYLKFLKNYNIKYDERYLWD